VPERAPEQEPGRVPEQARPLWRPERVREQLRNQPSQALLLQAGLPLCSNFSWFSSSG
jgi:hypothetical protein